MGEKGGQLATFVRAHVDLLLAAIIHTQDESWLLFVDSCWRADIIRRKRKRKVRATAKVSRFASADNGCLI